MNDRIYDKTGLRIRAADAVVACICSRIAPGVFGEKVVSGRVVTVGKTAHTLKIKLDEGYDEEGEFITLGARLDKDNRWTFDYTITCINDGEREEVSVWVEVVEEWENEVEKRRTRQSKTVKSEPAVLVASTRMEKVEVS